MFTTITCNGRTPNLLCYFITLTYMTTEKWGTSKCNETIETDFGVSKISQIKNRPKTKQTHENRKEIRYSSPQTKC